ncbi:peptidoglycan DD-metalloendopeptidase family protein [candidate division FCPU426 bacterium]|nr:peptidoglycan DD-metalloendopeptidase family protein [candidate division FCPU426 bacterium]
MKLDFVHKTPRFYMQPVRWFLFFGLIGILCAFALAEAIQTPGQHISVPVLHSPDPVRHYFAPERLQAFSGNGFNLRPELVRFLDQLEASLQTAGGPENDLTSLAAELVRYANPDFVTFEIYQIKRGDNYWQIAKERGFTIDTIVGCNPHLEKVICYTNQLILLPSRGGSLHQVREQESLDSIALDYAVEQESILQANGIDEVWGVIPGMWLFIPGAKPRRLTGEMHKQYARRALFRSPLAGRYTSFVGMRIHPVLGFSKYHNGVDIACPMGTWVGAAAEGRVTAAGWGGAIGKYIKIDHHNGYQTVYGHLDKIFVRQGQTINRGQLIGRAGCTGRVTGPHLHFTIYEHGRVVDPMDFLW